MQRRSRLFWQSRPENAGSEREQSMFVAHKGGPAARRRANENPNNVSTDASVAAMAPDAAPIVAPAAEPLRARPQPRKRTTPRFRVVQPQTPRGDITPKIAAFLDKVQPSTPCLVVDLDVVEQSYLAICRSLEPAQVYYSLKANPAPKILKLLNRLGLLFRRGEPGRDRSLPLARHRSRTDRLRQHDQEAGRHRPCLRQGRAPLRLRRGARAR